MSLSNNSFLKFTGYALILSVIFSLMNLLFVTLSAGFDFEIIENPERFVEISTDDMFYFKLGYWSDLVGWYFFFVPFMALIFVLMKDKFPFLANYAMINGVVYLVAGTFGAAILFHTIPYVYDAYHAAKGTGAELSGTEAAYNAMMQLSYRTLFNLVQPLFGGAFFLTIGLMLKKLNASFAILFLILGVVRFLEFILVSTGVSDLLAGLVFNFYLGFLPLISFLVALRLLSGKTWIA